MERLGFRVVTSSCMITGFGKHDTRDFVWTMHKAKEDWEASSKWFTIQWANKFWFCKHHHLTATKAAIIPKPNMQDISEQNTKHFPKQSCFWLYFWPRGLSNITAYFSIQYRNCFSSQKIAYKQSEIAEYFLVGRIRLLHE